MQAAVQAVQGTDALLFINDHWREAMAAGAYGAHLGQEDLDALGISQSISQVVPVPDAQSMLTLLQIIASN